MIRIILMGLLVIVTIPLFGQKQKEKNKSPVPTLNRSYTRFSVFSYQDDRYVHQETNNVWIDTYIETKPKADVVYLPGLEGKQSCKYILSECQFFNDDKNLQLAIIPIKCASQDNPDEKRILKIHYVELDHSSAYVYSLSFQDKKDLVLFHNYTDSELGVLLSHDLIRLE